MSANFVPEKRIKYLKPKFYKKMTNNLRLQLQDLVITIFNFKDFRPKTEY